MITDTIINWQLQTSNNYFWDVNDKKLIVNLTKVNDY